MGPPFTKIMSTPSTEVPLFKTTQSLKEERLFYGQHGGATGRAAAS